MRKLAGKWVVQAIATAAELELAEHLEQPRSLTELASRCRAQPEGLKRLLRVLQLEDLVAYHPHDDRYTLTPVGAALRDDGLRHLARFVASPSQWHPWVELTHAVQTGQCAFARTHGCDLYEYLARHPAEARLYDDAVDAFTAAQAQALASSSRLTNVRRVIDVGGGRGTFLLELLRRTPQLKGVLFDRPHVVKATAKRFVQAGLQDRVDVIGGDFHESVPPGGDAYVLNHVLHNWNDDQACALLRRCAKAMSPQGVIFVVDAILLPGPTPDGAAYMDLEMLVLTGHGRERSKPEFRQLYHRAGLRLQHMEPLGSDAWLMVVERRPSKGG